VNYISATYKHITLFLLIINTVYVAHGSLKPNSKNDQHFSSILPAHCTSAALVNLASKNYYYYYDYIQTNCMWDMNADKGLVILHVFYVYKHVLLWQQTWCISRNDAQKLGTTQFKRMNK